MLRRACFPRRAWCRKTLFAVVSRSFHEKLLKDVMLLFHSEVDLIRVYSPSKLFWFSLDTSILFVDRSKNIPIQGFVLTCHTSRRKFAIIPSFWVFAEAQSPMQLICYYPFHRNCTFVSPLFSFVFLNKEGETLESREPSEGRKGSYIDKGWMIPLWLASHCVVD